MKIGCHEDRKWHISLGVAKKEYVLVLGQEPGKRSLLGPGYFFCFGILVFLIGISSYIPDRNTGGHGDHN